ncbi:hypothetical protein J6590_028822 [Homalodisca vitripennis]|nr:hypothetical protein J6590_028822 [Homalodisca vitripennis]
MASLVSHNVSCECVPKETRELPTVHVSPSVSHHFNCVFLKRHESYQLYMSPLVSSYINCEFVPKRHENYQLDTRATNCTCLRSYHTTLAVSVFLKRHESYQLYMSPLVSHYINCECVPEETRELPTVHVSARITLH